MQLLRRHLLLPLQFLQGLAIRGFGTGTIGKHSIKKICNINDNIIEINNNIM
jgi:hypothetical protein